VGFVYVCASGIEETRRLEDSWCWLASTSSSSNPHQSHIERKKGERIGSGSEDKCVVRRAQMSGVDSRWKDVWDPRAGTGALFYPEVC